MKKMLPVILHILFWLLPLGIIIYFSDLSRKPNIYTLFYFLLQVGWCYVNIFIFLPKFMKRKKVPLLFVCYLLAFVLDPFISKGFAYLIGYRIRMNIGPALIQSVFVTGFFFFFSGCYYILLQWIKGEQERKTWENEKLKTELDFLKSQINPHFLFNTLNNIYTLTYQQSPQAPEAVMLLSEMMRYMLYDSSQPEVELNKELAYIREMISLHELRITGNFAVSLEVTGDISSVSIAPLMLVPFVENAFKHGVVNDREDPVKISLHRKADGIHFQVSNKIAPAAGKPEGGIGIKNVTRRLELLYADKHTLLITRPPGHFTIDLYLRSK